MSYDPKDHAVTTRHVLAGWIVCFGIVGLALAIIGERQAVSVAHADDPPYAGAAAERCPLSGVRLPTFAACAASSQDSTKLAQGRTPSAAASCG